MCYYKVRKLEADESWEFVPMDKLPAEVQRLAFGRLERCIVRVGTAGSADSSWRYETQPEVKKNLLIHHLDMGTVGWFKDPILHQRCSLKASVRS